MRSDSFPRRLGHALARGPDSAWIRKDLALLGWGESVRIDPGTGADRFDRALRELRATEAPVALASFTFDENTGGSIVIVPRALIRVGPDRDSFVIGDDGDIPAPLPEASIPRGHIGDDMPNGWAAAVEGALAAIRAKEVEKVVLSRSVQVRFDDVVPSHLVLANLARSEPASHTFLVDRFVGSSPELLASLTEGVARSVSLAGSADPGDLASFDTEKTAREHVIAADSVEEALGRFCPALDRSPSRVVAYGEIRHLSTSFEGTTHAGTRITDLLSALHPTAAVAGTPTKSALELIRELEGNDRGRYAGPVGWLDRSGDGEFAIALRCGQIEDRAAKLHAGAGIVDGSDPHLEFEETQMKLRPMLGALGLN